jgi:hypothetical protein
LKKRVGDVLNDEQIKECEELVILVDRDHQGTLLQIFTKPIGDRYVFLSITHGDFFFFLKNVVSLASIFYYQKEVSHYCH